MYFIYLAKATITVYCYVYVNIYIYVSIIYKPHRQNYHVLYKLHTQNIIYICHNLWRYMTSITKIMSLYIYKGQCDLYIVWYCSFSLTCSSNIEYFIVKYSIYCNIHVAISHIIDAYFRNLQHNTLCICLLFVANMTCNSESDTSSLCPQVACFLYVFIPPPLATALAVIAYNEQYCGVG